MSAEQFNIWFRNWKRCKSIGSQDYRGLQNLEDIGQANRGQIILNTSFK